MSKKFVMSKKLVSLVVGAVIAALALTTACSSATTASNPGSPGSTSSSPASPSNPATPGGTIMVPNTNPYYTLLVEGNQPASALDRKDDANTVRIEAGKLRQQL
jgi:ABC-type sugar transport system substrate-binding protein